MLRFYYNPSFKYTNRQLIDITNETSYKDIDYENIDSPDTINGHIIYTLAAGENIPTYVVNLDNGRRYYVSGITQLRTGKFQISLLRDIMSEEPMYWQNEEAYIEAGLATNYNKYKRWDLPFTNTKVKEERLNINGKSSFFVFYLNTQHASDETISEDDLEIKGSVAPGVMGYDYRVSNLNEIPGYEYVGAGQVNVWSTLKANARIRSLLRDTSPSTITQNWFYDRLNNNVGVSNPNPFISDTNNILLVKTYVYSMLENRNNTRNDFKTAMSNFMDSYISQYGVDISQDTVNELANYVDKIIYDTNTNKVYTIRSTRENRTLDQTFTNNQTGTLLSALRNINWVNATMGGNNFSQTGDYWYELIANATTYTYTLEELGEATVFDFNFISNVNKLPKSAVRCVNILGTDEVPDQKVAQALMLAQANATNTDDTGRILDIQYLPFSIATPELDTNDNIQVNEVSLPARFLTNDDYQYVTDLEDLQDIHKETDTIKIVSPSRASQFLFRPYNNDGNMLFQTKITIRPYTSSIYIRPSTQGLLVQDWDDKDCLIIQEDFSLTKVTSQWTEYIYNNRNYQNAFNRQIQGREFERQWEKKIEQAQAKSDEWTARNISAQKAQTYTGNIPVISGIAGAIGTAWQDTAYMQAAAMDRQYNQAMYEESINAAKDQFSYQLDNIQSQPLIPSSVTTIDAKFLDGVYLEYYSTNETELNAIDNYYRYNGNRIDSYGTFAEYYGWFVRGKIIKSQFYTQPEIDEVNRRLATGIFTEVNYD